MQCLLLGYKSGKEGLVMVPLGESIRPPQASIKDRTISSGKSNYTNPDSFVFHTFASLSVGMQFEADPALAFVSA